MALSAAQLRLALQHLEHGDWQAAHEIVQEDEESALACWAHPAEPDAASEARELNRALTPI